MRISIFLVFITSTLAWGQVGNEWINFGQAYYKIPVGKTGLYKLTRADLEAAGVPVSQMDPRRLQLYHRGQEQAINFQHQQSPADGTFDANEYFEFYGKKNDGTLDAELYKPAENQPHSYYNLFSDTTYYFLTTHPSVQGKRMSTFSQINSGGLPAESYHMSERLQLFTAWYSPGEAFNNYVQLSSFDQGEGWFSPTIRENNFSDITFSNLTNSVPAGGLPQLELQLVGRSSNNHRAEIYVGANTGSLRLLTTLNFSGYQPTTYSGALAWSDISAGGSLSIRVNVVGVSGPDFVSVAYAKVLYPRAFTMSGDTEREFLLAENANGKSYMEVSSTPTTARVFDITDPGSPIIIGTTQTTTLNAVVDDTETQRKLIITNQTITPTNIKKVSFRPLANGNADFVIISNKALRKAALGSSDPVKSYAAYRASVAGGEYDTLVVNVDQLFNQFSYGESTPLAIYRFLKFLEGHHRPAYLFLIGKGLDVSQQYYRNQAAFPIYKDYVPTAGSPGSDMYYSAALYENNNLPLIPTGRLSATNPEQIIQYLNKVIQQEQTNFTDLSRKRVLHLSGGIAPGEPETFKNYMEDFATVAEDQYLGGSVSAIAKRSLASQELINISEEVNNGLGLITFFGHSSISTTDFDIGYASDPVLGYANNGKYPMLLINGCNAGAFFGQYTLFGEDWTNASEKGAVGFIAHSYFGFVNNLKRYSDYFYEVGYGDSTFLKLGVGDVQKEVARRYLQNSFVSAQNITQVQQMILLGDPAVRLFGADAVDYHIDETAVSLQSNKGDAITASSPYIDVKLVIKNFGRGQVDPLKIVINRTLADNSTVSYDSTFDAVFYQDTLFFRLPNSLTQAGHNQLEIRLDADNEIREIRENNNTVAVEIFIPLNGTKNLYPQDFALVNSQQTELVFQSANLLDSLRSFVVEIDTSYLFNSNWKKRMTLEAEVLTRLPVELLVTDSTTYYWRTRLLYAGEEEYQEWESSSFTYLQNSVEGWGQLSFPQRLDNETEGILLNESSRTISFEENTIPVLIKTFGDLNTAPATDVSVKIDGAEYNLATQGQPCRDNTINLLAFNRKSTVPYAAIPFNFQDPRTCGREPQVIVSFTASEVYNGGADDLIEAINGISTGDSVVLFSIGNPGQAGWNANAINKLSEIGLSLVQLAVITTGEPFIIYGRKGAVEETALVFRSEIDPPAEQELVVNRQITGRNANGRITSTLIGPAQQWGQLKVSEKAETADEITYTIKGITAAGVETEFEANNDLSFIDAALYPNLKIEYYAEDEQDLTPAQPRYWIVEYEPLPEGLLFYKGNRETQQLEEGEMWTQVFGFTTVSPQSFPDSLVVKYNNLNKNTNQTTEYQKKIKSPLPGDTTDFTISINSLEKAGLNSVSVTVNPRITPEIYYDNNVLSIADSYLTTVDEFAPALSVTIDGRQLINGDFVSASPQIEIRIWDNNKRILKTDTTGVRLLLNGIVVYFTREDIQWSPATTTESFNVLFTPQNLAAGEYIFQVFAEDSRGNESGEEPYSITFVVEEIDEVMISAAYPNPTKDRLNFQLVITGEIPTGIKLEVTNSIGKLMINQDIPTTVMHTGTNYLTVPLSTSWTNGLYVYTLKLNNGKIQRGQFVVQR